MLLSAVLGAGARGVAFCGGVAFFEFFIIYVLWLY